MQQKELKDTQYHEMSQTIEKLQLSKFVQNKFKNQKVNERKEKERDFLEFTQARKKLEEDKKRKEIDYANIEREKSLLKQREIKEKNEQKILENAEKRREFLEFVECNKLAKEEEKARLEKEREYEYFIEILGNKKISHKKNHSQQISLEKTSFLFH